MDLALESLKEVIVLLRSSEIGNSGAILAKLPPSRFDCDRFRITAALPSLAGSGSVSEAVLQARRRCRERCSVFETFPKVSPGVCSLWRRQEGVRRHGPVVRGGTEDRQEGHSGRQTPQELGLPG